MLAIKPIKTTKEQQYFKWEINQIKNEIITSPKQRNFLAYQQQQCEIGFALAIYILTHRINNSAAHIWNLSSPHYAPKTALSWNLVGLTLPPLKQWDSQFTDRIVSAECLISVLHNLPEREFPYALRYLVLFSKMPREFPSPCVGCWSRRFDPYRDVLRSVDNPIPEHPNP